MIFFISVATGTLQHATDIMVKNEIFSAVGMLGKRMPTFMTSV